MPPNNLVLMELVILRFCLISPMWTPICKATSTGPAALYGWMGTCFASSDRTGRATWKSALYPYFPGLMWTQGNNMSCQRSGACVASWIHVCFILHGRLPDTCVTWPGLIIIISWLLRCWFHPYDDQVPVVVVGRCSC